MNKYLIYPTEQKINTINRVLSTFKGEIMKKFDPLYDKSSTGKLKFWKIAVFELGTKRAEIKIQHGYVGGKITTRTIVVNKGKNIGKVNSTTSFTQAVADAQSKWNKKGDKGYVSQMSKVGSKSLYLPMLAKTYYSKTCPDVVKGKVKETKVLFPIICQPKLNGVRCIARKENWEVKITSRLGKDYSIVCRKLANQLRLIMKNGDIWDGEIYVHKWSFQRIIRAVKKIRPDTRKLQFHRYDICNTKVIMSKRNQIMCTLPINKYIKQVFDVMLGTKFQIKHWHDIWVKDGYEGIILRKPDGLYKFGHRVPQLMKYKEFIDKEFKIVDFEGYTQEDELIQRTCVRYVCCIKDGATFEVIPRGSLKQREIMYHNAPNVVGKMLTVRYQELSEDSIPIFPVGLVVRDYE